VKRKLEELFQRFEGETFGIRAGGPVQGGDAELEKELSRRGLDAYQPAYGRYHLLRHLRTGRWLGNALKPNTLANRSDTPNSPGSAEI